MLQELDPLFLRACAELEQEGKVLVRDRYEENTDPLHNYQYHKNGHSSRVEIEARAIATIIHDYDPRLLTARQVRFTGPVARRHDEYIEFWVENGRMKRHIGLNEETSAISLETSMQGRNEVYGEVFKPQDFRDGFTGIWVTVPKFIVFNGHPTVIQPNLTRESSAFDFCIAAGDLSSAAIDPKRLMNDGDELYREENIQVWLDLSGIEPLSSTRKGEIRDGILNGTNFQIGFALGRKDHLEEDMLCLPEGVKAKIRTYYCRFDESAEYARDVYQKRKDMNFVEILDDVGYFKDTRRDLLNR